MPAHPRLPRRSALVGAAACAALGVGWPEPCAASSRAFGYHEHDGWYLRMGLGASSLHMSRRTKLSGALDAAAFEGGASRITGSASATELSLGVTPFAGVAVGLSLLSHSLPDATLQLTDGTGLPLDSALSFSLLGLSVDAFPYVDGGLHMGASFGLATAAAETPTERNVEALGGEGYGGAASLGYDWWIADQWSLGALTRFSLAQLSGREPGQGVTGTESDTVLGVGLMLTALHH